MGKKSIRYSFRVYDGDQPFIGTGRIELLQLIDKHGSIAKAAEAMSMSYKKAWQMVKDVNAVSKRPLVDIRLGGKTGGGASVTKEGLAAIEKYNSIKYQADVFFTKLVKEIDL